MQQKLCVKRMWDSRGAKRRGSGKKRDVWQKKLNLAKHLPQCNISVNHKHTAVRLSITYMYIRTHCRKNTLLHEQCSNVLTGLFKKIIEMEEKTTSQYLPS